MGAWRNLPGLVLGLLLLNAMFANAMFADDVASQGYPLRIKVLSAETHALNEGTPVPKNCDLANFDAYCNESKNPTAHSIMLVQDAKGGPIALHAPPTHDGPSANRCPWGRRLKHARKNTGSRFCTGVQRARSASSSTS